ncbi:MAG: asparagine--tRNA ligase [Enterobacteriaceae bacterium]
MKTLSILDIITNNNKILLKKCLLKINCWVRSRSSFKSGVSFIRIYDGSCSENMQVVVFNKIKNYNKEILKISTGCSISVIGNLRKSLNSNQKYEIYARSIKILGFVENPESYPISLKKHSFKFLRKYPHLSVRTNIMSSIFRVRSFLIYSIHKFMNKNNFFCITMPIVTSVNSEGEGVGKMFKLSFSNGKTEDFMFFKKLAYLTVSNQLNLENYVCSLSKVYSFGPVFRAEKSHTKRHLAEFWMFELEYAFKNLDNIINFAELMIKNIILDILKNCKEDIYFLCKKIDNGLVERLNYCLSNKFIILNYDEAIKILYKSKNLFSKEIEYGDDLSYEHEKFLLEKNKNIPLIIKNFPRNKKPFYMRVNNDGKTVSGMDFIFPKIGELIGGSQREERLDKLKENMKLMNINGSNYNLYLDLRKYGTIVHSGFGIGFERLLMFITGINDIRDVTPFPNYLGNLKS